MVAAIWTYGYRLVRVKTDTPDEFNAEQSRYHPYLQEWRPVPAFYWSEIDFPEYGKAGECAEPIYNIFITKQKESKPFDVHGVADGGYHTYTTEWRNGLVPIPEVEETVRTPRPKAFTRCKTRRCPTKQTEALR